MNFTLKKSEIIHRGKVFDLQVDEVVYESGNTRVREIAVHRGGAVAVALTKDYKIVLVNQFRYPLQKFTLELPAGKIDNGEDPEECAKRELEEETGYKAGQMKKLGAIATTPGFCTEILHIYLATDLSKGNLSREEGEYGMTVAEFTLKEIEEKIKAGEIYDAKTISGIMLAKMHLTSESTL
jgi:ADP-ribose pyrophosphatase